MKMEEPRRVGRRALAFSAVAGLLVLVATVAVSLHQGRTEVSTVLSSPVTASHCRRSVVLLANACPVRARHVQQESL